MHSYYAASTFYISVNYAYRALFEIPIFLHDILVSIPILSWTIALRVFVGELRFFFECFSSRIIKANIWVSVYPPCLNHAFGTFVALNCYFVLLALYLWFASIINSLGCINLLIDCLMVWGVLLWKNFSYYSNKVEY